MNWILLRGLGRESQHWGDFGHKMMQAGVANNLFALDYPGSGVKNSLRSPMKIQDYVKFLRPEFLTIKRQIEGPWSIMGISMGGMVGLTWLDLYSEDFEAGVFINTSASNFSSPLKRMSLGTIKNIMRLFFDKTLEEREKYIYELTVHLSLEKELQTQAEWVKIARNNPISSTNFLIQLLAAARFKAPQKINNPLLFLASKKDQLADASCSMRLAEHFGACCRVHDEAGHDIPLDDPIWLLDACREFIEKN